MKVKERSKQKDPKPLRFKAFQIWRMGDLNPRPLACHAVGESGFGCTNRLDL
jgi:hypothetical protein